MTDDPRSQYRDPTRLNTRIDLHARFSTNPQGWHRWLFEQMALVAGEAVLDVGCGNGVFWASNAASLPRRLEVCLADLSPGMAAAASRRVSTLQVGAKFCTANIEALPFKDASFDAVLASHMMYHVDDVARAFGEVKRVLRAGGRFFCSTNGLGHMRELGAFVKAANPKWPGFVYIERFGLENARSFLAPHFASVELKRYSDSLEITDASAAVDYVLSMQTVSDPKGVIRRGVMDAVTREIRQKGSFHVSKESGLFYCRR